VQLFPITLHAKLYTFEKSSTLKDKCAINALNCNLFTGPLINMIFKEQQTILKERAFPLKGLLTKTNLYVAVHHSKALDLRIGRRS